MKYAYLLFQFSMLGFQNITIADLYKCPTQNGGVGFSDKPCSDGFRKDGDSWVSVAEEQKRIQKEKEERERIQQEKNEKERLEILAREKEVSKPKTISKSIYIPSDSRARYTIIEMSEHGVASCNHACVIARQATWSLAPDELIDLSVGDRAALKRRWTGWPWVLVAVWEVGSVIGWPSIARRAAENVAEVGPEAKTFARWVRDLLDDPAQLPDQPAKAPFDRELNRATNPLP